MDFIFFLLSGAVAGWLAGLIFRGGGYGLIWNIIVGIVGGAIGGWLFGNFFGESLFGGIITAVFGGIILLWIANRITRK
jgi:uncharacterized membrane protein YeaQ/YmgE (transglycosylase-associated protein family)